MLLIRQSEATIQIQHSGMRQWVEDQYQVLHGYGSQWLPDELGWFAVWGEGDDPHDKGFFLGVRNLLQNPYDPEISFETVKDHGEFYEIVILLSDQLSVAVLISKDIDLDPNLRRVLTEWISA